MAAKPHRHKHPEVEQHVKALARRVDKLEKQLRDLQRRLKTHDHPHTH